MAIVNYDARLRLQTERMNGNIPIPNLMENSYDPKTKRFQMYMDKIMAATEEWEREEIATDGDAWKVDVKIKLEGIVLHRGEIIPTDNRALKVEEAKP